MSKLTEMTKLIRAGKKNGVARQARADVWVAGLTIENGIITGETVDDIILTWEQCKSDKGDLAMVRMETHRAASAKFDHKLSVSKGKLIIPNTRKTTKKETPQLVVMAKEAAALFTDEQQAKLAVQFNTLIQEMAGLK